MEQDTKLCSRCEETKPWSEFFIDRKRGRPQAYCKPCLKAYNKARYVPKTPPHATECQMCGGPMPTGRSSRTRRFCSPKCGWTYHNEKFGPAYRRDSYLRSTYGIDLVTYNGMLQAAHGRCPLCGRPEAESKNGVLHVDHCHDTGKVRGLLCHRCNWIIGQTGDDAVWLRRAADYLERV